METENRFSDFINSVSIQAKVENIWSYTCRSWQELNEQSLLSFLSQCLDYNLDPQYCLNWVDQHKVGISNWKSLEEAGQNWVNVHTSSGSPIIETDENFT